MCATAVWGLRAGTVRLAFGLLQVIAASLKPRRPEPPFHAVAERPGSVELNGLEDSPFLWPFKRFFLKLEEPARSHVARDLGASIDRATIERPLDVVRRRVRWTPMSSAARFGKTGRVGESWQPFQSEVGARRLAWALRNVERLDGKSSLVGLCA